MLAGARRKKERTASILLSRNRCLLVVLVPQGCYPCAMGDQGSTEATAVNKGANTPVDQVYIFGFGVLSIIGGLTVSLIYQDPPAFPRVVVTVLIALGGAAIASSITGFLEVRSKWVRAGGALGVLVFLCLFMWQSAGTVR